MAKNLCLIISFILSIATTVAQQKSLSVGLKLLNEIDVDNGTLYPGVGGQLVYRITKHSGIETGLFYSAHTNNFLLIVNGTNSYGISVGEHWLKLPLLYRFDSKIVNFVFGPQIEYFLGWRNKIGSVQITSYSRDAARFGVATGLSKSIALSSTLLLEPEARLTFYPSDESGTLGINLALRKKIF